MNSMDTAPKDGTKIIAYGPWTGPFGVQVWWEVIQGIGFWKCDGGIAAYEFTGWEKERHHCTWLPETFSNAAWKR